MIGADGVADGVLDPINDILVLVPDLDLDLGLEDPAWAAAIFASDRVSHW